MAKVLLESINPRFGLVEGIDSAIRTISWPPSLKFLLKP
jgi:hypothetical protein